MIPTEMGIALAERRTDLPAQVTRRYFTVDEYHRMGEAGIFTEDDRVELIEGEILMMRPTGSHHAGNVNRVSSHLHDLFGKRAVVAVQNPIVLNDTSEPQPDISVLRPRNDFYSQSHPTPQDILIVIEVADTTLAYDRDIKLPAYARSGIAEVWIIDLEHQAISAHSDPANGGYQNVRSYRRGDSIAPVHFSDLSIAVSDTLA